MAVTFDAVGAGNTVANGTSVSQSHTIAGNAIVAFINVQTGSSTRPTVGVTVGGTPMTELATRTNYTNNGFYWYSVVAFGLLAPPTGAQSVVATIGANSYCALNSVSYNNVASFGTPATAGASGSSASLSVASTSDQMVAQAFSDYDTTFTAYNKTSRWNRSHIPSVCVSMVIGDAVGDPSLSFTATAATGWGGIGVPMSPSASNTGRFFALF